MRKTIILALAATIFLSVAPVTWRQEGDVNAAPQGVVTPVQAQEIDLALDEEATEAAEATPSGIVERVVEKKPDLTEPEGEVKGKLERLLEQQELGPLNVTNVLRYAINNAVRQGVPANLVVLLLLFPLVTAIIAASRHLIGLRGFGIFTPAVVSVGFLATGLVTGLLLFGIILVVATMGRVIVRRLQLPYLPRTSLLLWMVSLAVLALLLVSPFVGLESLATLSIFPILLLVLLAETFIDVQSRRSMQQAIEMTIETLVLAIISFFVMELEGVQQFVLLNPELSVLFIGGLNIFVGRFMGLRLLEYFRFRELFA